MNQPSALNPARRCGLAAGSEVFAARFVVRFAVCFAMQQTAIAIHLDGAPPGAPLR